MFEYELKNLEYDYPKLINKYERIFNIPTEELKDNDIKEILELLRDCDNYLGILETCELYDIPMVESIDDLRQKIFDIKFQLERIFLSYHQYKDRYAEHLGVKLTFNNKVMGNDYESFILRLTCFFWTKTQK